MNKSESCIARHPGPIISSIPPQSGVYSYEADRKGKGKSQPVVTENSLSMSGEWGLSKNDLDRPRLLL